MQLMFCRGGLNPHQPRREQARTLERRIQENVNIQLQIFCDTLHRKIVVGYKEVLQMQCMGSAPSLHFGNELCLFQMPGWLQNSF